MFQIKQAIQDYSRWRDTFDLHGVAVFLHHEEKKFGLSVLRRLLQLSCEVVEHTREDVLMVANEFVDGLFEERGWAMELVKTSNKWYMLAVPDKQHESWVREESELAIDCVLYTAVRDYYGAQQLGDEDADMEQERARREGFSCVFGGAESPELAELVALLRNVQDDNSLSRYAVTAVFSLFYAAAVYSTQQGNSRLFYDKMYVIW